MQINTDKTKNLVVSKEFIRCKLVANDRPIEQVRRFNYLGAEIAIEGDLKSEVFKQVCKAAFIYGSMKQVVWKNKNVDVDSKFRIYKTCLRPIMTYGIEMRADTKRTKAQL
jgi:hypothetical protein